MSSPHPAHRTLEALGSIRTAATPAVPTIIALLDRFNGSEGNRIPYVCSIAADADQHRAAIARGDRGGSQVIASQLPAHGVCHVCGCALELLTVSGPAARDIAGPVLQKATADPLFITTYDLQLGRALKAIGLSSSGQTGGGRRVRTRSARAARQPCRSVARTGRACGGDTGRSRVDSRRGDGAAARRADGNSRRGGGDPRRDGRGGGPGADPRAGRLVVRRARGRRIGAGQNRPPRASGRGDAGGQSGSVHVAPASTCAC